MANLSSADVEVLRTNVRALSNGSILFEKTCRLTASVAAGTVANQIPASAFGLQTVEEVSTGVKSDNTLTYTFAPSADNSQILNRNPATGAPADLTIGHVLYLTVRGY